MLISVPVVSPINGGAGVREPLAYGSESGDFRLDYRSVTFVSSKSIPTLA